MNYEDNAMRESDPESLCDELRRLAFENPRAARVKVEELLRSDDSQLFGVLRCASGPGNGRLRQMIANATRTESDRIRLQEYFGQWLEVETDEFTKRAVEHAQRGEHIDTAMVCSSVPACDPLLVDMYRYVTGRLGHELRNALLEPKTCILKLRGAIRELADDALRASMQSLLEQLEDDFARVGRVCEFEPTDDHFAIQSIVLRQWLESMNTQYGKQYQAIGLTFEGSPDALKARIRGSHHFLRMVFWNLWVNSHQAANGPCRITINMEVTGDNLSVVVTDNGPGIPDRFDGLAFKDQISTKSPDRGRGFLEVQHAINELHGSAFLARQPSGELRVALRLALEQR